MNDPLVQTWLKIHKITKCPPGLAGGFIPRRPVPSTHLR
jgi:hypothetical protein